MPAKHAGMLPGTPNLLHWGRWTGLGRIMRGVKQEARPSCQDSGQQRKDGLSGAPAAATAQRAASTSTAMCVAFIAARLADSFTAAWNLPAHPTEPALVAEIFECEKQSI